MYVCMWIYVLYIYASSSTLTINQTQLELRFVVIFACDIILLKNCIHKFIKCKTFEKSLKHI